MSRFVVIFGLLAVVMQGLMSCQSDQYKYVIRDFFPRHVDTTWFNDTNYWWMNNYAHVDYSTKGIYYKFVINTDHYKIDAYIRLVDSVLSISFDPLEQDEVLVDFRNPFCSFTDSGQINMSIFRIGDLPIIDDSYPRIDYIFWAFSMEDGLLGMAFNDTLSQRWPYVIGSYWCCDSVCDTTLLNHPATSDL